MIRIIKEKEISAFIKRSLSSMDDKAAAVKAIVADVRQNGDSAVFKYAKKFDGIDLNENNIRLTDEEIDAAIKNTPENVLTALKRAYENILEFHSRSIRKDSIIEKNGRTSGSIYRPVERAGIYVPGGKAAYPSSVLMCAIPAIAAGVNEIIMSTPGGEFLNSATVAAAKMCGVKSIFRAGGAHGVAAMGLGTNIIPKCDVIAGPGNIYVALAKREIYGDAAIDMIAGPSEILIIADESANPEFIAADMLSQAEHDELAMSMLVTDSKGLAEKVNKAVERRLALLPKKDIAKKSLENYGAIVLTENLEQSIRVSNSVAPEHLEIMIKNQDGILSKIKNAGAVFLGDYSPEPLGDYFAGTNHVLPTNGTSKFFSGLSADNYIKKINVIKYSKKALLEDACHIISLAECEGLTAHAESIRVRKEV